MKINLLFGGLLLPKLNGVKSLSFKKDFYSVSRSFWLIFRLFPFFVLFFYVFISPKINKKTPLFIHYLVPLIETLLTGTKHRVMTRERRVTS